MLGDGTAVLRPLVHPQPDRTSLHTSTDNKSAPSLRQKSHTDSHRVNRSVKGPGHGNRDKSRQSESRNNISSSSTTQAALKAARLSASAHLDSRHLSEHSNVSTPKSSPYVAAASIAWSKATTAKLKDEDKHLKIEHNLTRKSVESFRSATSDLILPATIERSKSQMSDSGPESAPRQHDHNGSLQAARKSYEIHRTTEPMPPPSRPSSARPINYAIHADKRFSQSCASLHARHWSPPPPAAKSSMESSNRSALAAASITWASHDMDPKPVKPPEEYHYIIHKPQLTLRKIHKETVGKFLKHGRVQPIPPNDRKRYEGLWAANKGLLQTSLDEVCNVIVKDIWQRSRLQAEILSDIYALVDRDRRGTLSRDEFVVGTWLVDHCLRGRKLPLKADLPDEIFDRGPLARLGVSLPKALKRDERKLMKRIAKH